MVKGWRFTNIARFKKGNKFSVRNEINNFKTDTACICPGFLKISLYWKIKKSQNCSKE